MRAGRTPTAALAVAVALIAPALVGAEQSGSRAVGEQIRGGPPLCQEAICYLGRPRVTAGREIEFGTLVDVDAIEVSYDADARTSASYDPGAVDGFWPAERSGRDTPEGSRWGVLPVPGGDEEILPGGEALVHVTAYRRLEVVGEADFVLRLRSAAGRVRIKPTDNGGTISFRTRVKVDADLFVRLEGRGGKGDWSLLTEVSKRVRDLGQTNHSFRREIRPGAVRDRCENVSRCRIVLGFELSTRKRGERYFLHSAREKRLVRLRNLG